ncbi:MAG TPA: ankyrin repeat domain-containing protein, partial [Acidobacteriota bacterium]
MTPIHCPECSTEVPGSANACPKCNFPISKLRGLSAAILTRNADRVAGLIQLGADVNAADKSGRTPLITAALMDDEEIVQMLLAAGAKPDFVNSSGESALSVAKSRDVERLIRRAIVVSRFKSLQKTAPETVTLPASEVIPETPVIETIVIEPLKHFEKQEAKQPIYEETKLDFDQSLNEAALWENRRHFLSATLPAPEAPIKEEPTLKFDDSLMFSEALPWEKPIEDHSEAAPIDLQSNEELFEFPSHVINPIVETQEINTFETSPKLDDPSIYKEVLEWENRKDDNSWLQPQAIEITEPVEVI